MDNMSSFGPGRILVVERDRAVSRFVEFVLGNWESFEVASVADPAIALAVLGNEPWDLVLVDFELPDTGVVDSLGLLEAIREVEPGLPVAMMTAYPVLGATAEKLAAADGYITKPITPSHLIGLATGLIERFRRTREQANG
jgi:DNA-binding response OmpR family regulator